MTVRFATKPATPCRTHWTCCGGRPHQRSRGGTFIVPGKGHPPA